MAWAGFQQSDPGSTPPTVTAHCGSGAVHSTAVGSAMDAGTGTTNHAFKVPNDNVGRVYINWVGSPSTGNNEPSLVPGTWDVQLDITSGSSLVKTSGIWICHEDSAGNPIETIASHGLLTTMSTGVHTFTFTNKAPSSWKAGDRIVYVVAYVQPTGFFTVTIRQKFDKNCMYPRAVDDWRGVTLGGGYPDRKREGVI